MNMTVRKIRHIGLGVEKGQNEPKSILIMFVILKILLRIYRFFDFAFLLNKSNY